MGFADRVSIWSAIRSGCLRNRLFTACRWLACWGLAAGLTLFFSGCAAPPVKIDTVSTIITEPVAEGIGSPPPDFRLLGRVSVKGGKESFSAGVQWHHSQENDDILLLSPLGQALAQIQRTSEGVSLMTSEREHYQAEDAESLTEQVLGWRLPLAGLQYWVQGMNSPATSSEMDLDKDGRVMTIRQDGWEINYSRYAALQPALGTQGDLASGQDPKNGDNGEKVEGEAVQMAGAARNRNVRAGLLTLARDGLQIKLVIDDWNFSNY